MGERFLREWCGRYAVLTASRPFQPPGRTVVQPCCVLTPHPSGRALMRLESDNVVSPLAGHRELCGTQDGPGPSARFQLPHSLVADGAGCLYVGDCGAVRRVALPGAPAAAAGAGADPMTAVAALQLEQQQLAGPLGMQEPVAMVTTV
jgi:hypothetical protein